MDRTRAEKLIGESGKPSLGYFDGVIDHINIEDADYRTALNKRASAFRKNLDFKRFQYFGGVSDSVIFGCAMADVRYLGAVFAYVYDMEKNDLKTWQVKAPLAYGMDLSNRQDNRESRFQFGKWDVAMRYDRDRDGTRCKSLELRIGDEVHISAQMDEGTDFEPLVQCVPSSINGWIYAQKTAALKVTGQINCPEGNYDLTTGNCYGHHDYSAGFMRRHTFWNWACFSGHNGDNALGLNVSWGVNETGWSENCLWVDGKLHLLPQAQFHFDRDNEMSPWRVSSGDGRVDLTFDAVGLHKEQLDLKILATWFKQIFGRFAGTVTDSDGKNHQVDGVYGFVEDHFSKW